ncbi:MAG: biotin--[acetyl-CoA-carboxylase] ligase [Betaproteobacteria bacterium]|nr:biotin--[acetyl-CoA-carboxylase] ligase [Betaproteobacteria bacterium]
MTLINPALVREAWPDADFPFLIESVETCDSTNARLLARAAEDAPFVLVADRQTAGRGRQGKAWESTPEGSLTFSLLWRFAPSRIGGLSLAIGLALLRALERLGAKHLSLKWPNDLIFAPPGAESGKLAGILIELASGADKTAVVIGIGLNLFPPQGFAAAGLADCLPAMPSRNRLLAEILVDARQVLVVLEEHGFSALREEWQARHAYQNCAVILQNAGNVEAGGICRGVDAEGALLLEMSGKLSRFFAGDLSMRPKPEEREP